jgi:hypothetical protein
MQCTSRLFLSIRPGRPRMPRDRIGVGGGDRQAGYCTTAHAQVSMSKKQKERKESTGDDDDG